MGRTPHLYNAQSRYVRRDQQLPSLQNNGELFAVHPSICLDNSCFNKYIFNVDFVEQPSAHDVFLAVQGLAQQQTAQVSELLKARSGLSAPQFNVLRILRGAEAKAGGEGLTCGEIGERLLAYVPDVTRLLDRLEKQSLICRSRERSDRRVVTSRLTPLGAELLQGLDSRVTELHRAQFAHLSADQLTELLRLLQTAAQHPQTPTFQGEST